MIAKLAAVNDGMKLSLGFIDIRF